MSGDGVSAATRAIAIDSADHVAYLFKGSLLFVSGQQETGLADVRRAHELNPNHAHTLSALGFSEAMMGEVRKGVEYTTQALRLSPRDPSRWLLLNYQSWAHFAACDYVNALESAQSAVSEAPRMPSPRMCLVVSRMGLGQLDRARADFQILSGLAPELVQTRLAGTWLSIDPGYKRRATTFMRIAAGLEDPSAAEALR